MQLTLLKLPKNFLSPPLYLCGDRNSLGLYLCRSNKMENWISFLDHPVEKSFCLFQGSLGTETSVTPLLVDRECHVALSKTKAEKKILLIKEKACLSLRLCPNKWKKTGDWSYDLNYHIDYLGERWANLLDFRMAATSGAWFSYIKVGMGGKMGRRWE